MYLKGCLEFRKQNTLFLDLDIIAMKLLCQRFRRQNTWFADQYKFFTVVHGEHDDPSEVRGSTLYEPNPAFSTQPVWKIKLYKISMEWTGSSIESFSGAEYLVSLVWQLFLQLCKTILKEQMIIWGRVCLFESNASSPVGCQIGRPGATFQFPTSLSGQTICTPPRLLRLPRTSPAPHTCPKKARFCLSNVVSA